MKTMKELREQHCELYEDLKADKVKAKDAIERNNAAGKIINSVKAQLEYFKLRNEKPQIEFMKCH